MRIDPISEEEFVIVIKKGHEEEVKADNCVLSVKPLDLHGKLVDIEDVTKLMYQDHLSTEEINRFTGLLLRASEKVRSSY
jgi:hypothetical protein